MNADLFVKSYMEYLTLYRNISLAIAKPIAYNSLLYSSKNLSSNYLLSLWDDLGIEELCANVYLYLANEGKSDIKDLLDKYKKDISYLTDFLHHQFASYREIPNIDFEQSVIENILCDNNDIQNVYDKILKLAPGMEIIIEHAKNVLPAHFGEIKALVAASKDGNEYAKNRLFDLYLNPVMKQSLYFTERYDLPFEDCFQNASIGFISAVEKYDFNIGYSFGNYYGLWVRQQILRNLSEIWCYRIVPVHVMDKVLPIYDYLKDNLHDFENIQNLPDSFYKKISKKINLPIDVCQKCIKLFICDESYESITYDEDSLSSIFIEQDYDYLNVATYHSLQKQLEDVFNTLTGRESQILKLRFGIGFGHPHTLEEVGSYMGVTRERVRQIEARALRKLRHPSRSKKLKEYLE